MPHPSATIPGLRVLVVEDEFLIADEMTGWLSRAGAETVGPVPDVEQALELIAAAKGTLDAAVLDANLGEGETAYPVADRLDELGIPYLFATGDVQLVDQPTYRSKPRLEKPVSEGDLLKILEKIRRPRTRT